MKNLPYFIAILVLVFTFGLHFYNVRKARKPKDDDPSDSLINLKIQSIKKNIRPHLQPIIRIEYIDHSNINHHCDRPMLNFEIWRILEGTETTDAMYNTPAKIDYYCPSEIYSICSKPDCNSIDFNEPEED